MNSASTVGYESDFPQKPWDVKRQTGRFVGSRPVLFLEDSCILATEKAERNLHPLSKDPEPMRIPLPFDGIANPVVRSLASAPGDKDFYAYVSGNYRGRTLFLVYTTADGRELEPVQLDQITLEDMRSILEIRGEPDFNNILIFDPENGRSFPPYYCTFFRVYTGGQYPYGGIAINKSPRPRRAKIFRSKDGLRWEETGNADREVTFESNMPSYDPFGDRYLLYLRLWDPPKKPVAGWRKVIFSELVGSENGGQWTEDELVLEADQDDGPAADIYFMQVSWYAGYYIGLPAVYHRAACHNQTVRGTIHGQLATSIDGRSWERVCQGEQFLPLGEPGAWDSGMVCPICGPYKVGDQLLFYYSGQVNRHDEPLPKDYHRDCGLARLRLDGFVSMDAGDEGGMVLTTPIWPAGKYLYINADASGGEIRVEVLQDYTYVELKEFEAGKEGRGLFRVENCVPFTGDSTCHRVEWINGENFLDSFPPGWNLPEVHAELEGRLHFTRRAIALKFYLRNAKLYSYWFADGVGCPGEERLFPAGK